MSRAWPVRDVDPNASLRENARRILAVRMAEFYSYTPVVRQSDAITALHDLRIATKRLRYTLELFSIVFGDHGQVQIQRTKALQEALGDLHDHDVRIDLIEDELANHQDVEGLDGDGDPRPGLIAYLARERQRRSETFDQFVSLWDQFDHAGMRSDLAELSASADVRA